MEIQGERRLPASPPEVWDALHDPDVLRSAIPGCEFLEETAPDRYDLTVQVGIAAIRGTYTGSVQMTEGEPPNVYRLVARGQGRAGAAEGDAHITLEPSDDGTLLRYRAQVRAQGAIARLGSRIIGGAARMMAGRFFDAFEQELTERTA